MANVESAELQTIKMFLLRGRLGTHYYWTGSIDAFEIEIDSTDDDCRFWTGKVMLAQGSFDETERVKEQVLLGLSLRYIFDHEDAYTLEDGVEFSEMNPKDIFEVVEFQDMVEFWRDDINDLDMAWKDRNHGDCFQDDVMKAIMRSTVSFPFCISLNQARD
ncbi:uncharacterized protein LOC122059494 isoform X6 [Macadamia integrifolia]|uniref:uncharacterized protein LOC122059494 isoform X6 n=1 Tax=Macadamia integrifolia TaxID=60698 RepID=UPI001C52F967|nr:uncharacterized protein LOC122059494 isoform X6 [Macadamia integrifolia]